MYNFELLKANVTFIIPFDDSFFSTFVMAVNSCMSWFFLKEFSTYDSQDVSFQYLTIILKFI